MHGGKSDQSSQNRAKVREALMEHWDPIGVQGEPNAQDEYDAYVGKVYMMLMDERASTDAIFDYLLGVATETMCLRPTPELLKCSRDAASILVRLRPEFEAHQ